MPNRFAPTRRPRYRLWVGNHFWLFVLFFGSVGLVTFIMLGTLIHWLRGLIVARSNPLPPGNSLYPNNDALKITTDERYYLQQVGLDLEYITLVADDGQVLHLHHVIDPKELTEQRDHRKPVLMQHGLLALLGAYFSGGFNSLAYIFTKAGYDVYLLNNRLWFQFEHKTLDGSLKHNQQYWDWELRDLAGYDLPCHVQAVLLRKPHHKKLIYIGHSQGCTQMTIALRNPELKHLHQLIEFIGFLCPALYPGKLFHTRYFLKFLRLLPRWLYRCFIGPCVFLGILGTCRHYLATTNLFGASAYGVMNYLFGWSAENFEPNTKVRNVHFVFVALYVLGRLMHWWTLHWVLELFANELLPRSSYRDDSHYRWLNPVPPINREAESHLYFPFTEPWFAETGVQIPMVMFTGGKDHLVDGLRAASHMKHGEPNYEENHNFWHYHVDNYTHVDVTWAQNLPQVVAEPLLRHIRENEARTEDKEANEKQPQPTDSKAYLRQERHTGVDELHRTFLRSSVYVADDAEEQARLERRILRRDRRRLGLTHSTKSVKSAKSNKSGRSGKSSRYLEPTNPPALPPTAAPDLEKFTAPQPPQPAYHPSSEKSVVGELPALAKPVAPPVMNAAAS